MSQTQRGKTTTVYTENIQKEMTTIKENVRHGMNQSDHIREAIRLYVTVLELKNEYNLDWDGAETRHQTRRYIMKGIKRDLDAQ